MIESGRGQKTAARSTGLFLKDLFTAVLLSALLLTDPTDVFAAISAKILGEGGSAVNQASYDITLNATPDSNTLILAWITNSYSSAPDLPTSVTSGGLTWVQVPDATCYGGQATLFWRTTLYWAVGTPTANNTVTVKFPRAQYGCAWSIIQFTGTTITSNALIQSLAVWTPNGPAAYSITLAELGNPLVNATAGNFGYHNAPSTFGDGYSGTSGFSYSAPNLSIRTEWKIPGNRKVDITQSAKGNISGVAVEIKAATTTLRTGTDPGNATIAPGVATLADSFTFETDGAPTPITNVTVTLTTGSSAFLSKVEITDETGDKVYGFVNNPSSDAFTIPLSTNILTVTATATPYKIRITPKSHTDMPAPPGGTYVVTAYISNWTDPYFHEGSDSGDTQVTIDNLSPADVSAAAANHGDRQVSMTWANPADADFANVVVLRKTASPVSDRPAEGTTYAVGDSVGGSKVACVVAKPGASCTDADPTLTNGPLYFYKIFAKDTNGNYSATGVAALYYLPDLMIKTSAADDVYLTDNTYEPTAANQLKSQGSVSGSPSTYVVRLQNDGTAPDALVVTGTGGNTEFTVHYTDESNTDVTSLVASGPGYKTPDFGAGESREWTVTVTPNGGSTPTPGGRSYPIIMTATSFHESKRDQVKAVTTSTSANITLLINADKSSCKPGEEITYTTTASNGASLTDAKDVAVVDPIPANTGFKLGSASCSPGTANLACTITYYQGNSEYTPSSGGCEAPAGYDYCVTHVKWNMVGTTGNTSGAMPSGTSFTCGMIVRVK